MKIVVLGGGRVGSAIVRDLSTVEGYTVVAADIDPLILDRLASSGVETRAANFADPEGLAHAVEDADLVVGAVPGFMGFDTAQQVLEAGKPIVDISFFPEDAMGLAGVAEAAGVPCVVDCGVAPGLSNMILGRMEEQLDGTENFECLVGGLPVERDWPWEYKAPFSPRDVIEEYTRPARIRENGEEVVVDALSDVERITLPGLGTLEAFNTDGLRSLLHTCSTPNMSEKTLRYPGHAELMKILRSAGFFSDRNIQVASGQVRPRDVTEVLLFDAWQFEDGEPDLTVMRVTVDGRENGKAVRHTWNLLDYYNPDTETSSMARTTGYTCTGVVNLVAQGMWTKPGLATPEMVGRDGSCFSSVAHHLRDRGVHLFHHVEELD